MVFQSEVGPNFEVANGEKSPPYLPFPPGRPDRRPRMKRAAVLPTATLAVVAALTASACRTGPAATDSAPEVSAALESLPTAPLRV